MPTRTRAELLLLATTLVWGSTFVVIKESLADASPILFMTLRFSLACVLLTPLVARRLCQLDRGAAGRGAILGLLLFTGFTAQTVGLEHTTASKSAFVTGMLVVLTPLGQLAITRKALHVGNGVGVVLVTLGLYLLTSPAGSAFNVGDALTLVCAITFALYIVLVDVFTQRYDPWQMTWMQFLVTSVLCAIAAALLEDPYLVPSAPLVASISYLAVFATLGALAIQMRFQRDTTPTRAALIFALEPVFAAALAWATLGEAIGATGIFGAALMVGGVLVSELWEAVRKRV